MKLNEKISRIVNEELTKSDVNSIVNNKIDSKISSMEFEKKIKEITSSVINDLFKTLWQRNSFWKSGVK